jgi:2-polyprenyl-6-methoxyphenol hydroxylase-like FAD-dependent oxidoreductase
MDADVVVVGAGPAGLLLAAELALAGVDVVVVERRVERSSFERGYNLNPRSLEILDRRGLVERFLAEGPTVALAPFTGLGRPLSLEGLAVDHPYSLGISQNRTEQLIEQRAVELGARLLRGHRVTGLAQHDHGVDVTVEGRSGRRVLSCRYLAGCDGAHSTVRHLLGVGFPGTPATRRWLVGDVALTDPGCLPFGTTETDHGAVTVIPRAGYVRIITEDPDPSTAPDRPLTLPELQQAVDHAAGGRVGLAHARHLTRFDDTARQADRYVVGRVTLAGDAAQVAPPTNAQGANVAIADAFNLGWKLAGAVAGWGDDDLIETYHAERHATGARLLRHTRAQIALNRQDEHHRDLRDLLTELADLDPVEEHLAGLATGLDTRYEMGGAPAGHARLGRPAPNLTLVTDAGPRRLNTLLHDGRGALVAVDAPHLLRDAAPWASRLHLLDAHDAHDVDPSATDLTGLRGLVVRPDGHIAWIQTGDPPPAEPLTSALRRWFGTPA